MEQRAFAAKAGVSFSGVGYWLYKIRREQGEGRIFSHQSPKWTLRVGVCSMAIGCQSSLQPYCRNETCATISRYRYYGVMRTSVERASISRS